MEWFSTESKKKDRFRPLSLTHASVLLILISLFSCSWNNPYLAETAGGSGGGSTGPTPWTENTANPLFGDASNRAYYPAAVKVGSTYHIWYGDGTRTRHATGTMADFSDYSFPGTEIAVGGTAISGVFTNAYHPAVYYNTGGWTVNSTGTTDGFLLYITSGWNSVHVLHSADGDDWIDFGTCTGILGGPDQGTVIYNFSVLYEGGTTWRGYSDNGGGHIQYFTSSDGFNWTVQAADILGTVNQSWESYSSWIAPRIVLSGSTYFLYYSSGATRNDSAIGMAYSTDGATFTKAVDNPIFSIDDGIAWRDARTYTPWVFWDTDHWRMYFTGRSSAGVYSVGMAEKWGSL